MDGLAPGKREWVLTKPAFEQLLVWLHPDRDRAGEKYEQIRSALVKIFICRGCSTPEDLADETINRVVRKLPGIASDYVGDPALYFSGVAKYVILEQDKKNTSVPLSASLIAFESPSNEGTEQESVCLQNCLGNLTSANRDLILQYYSGEKHSKIENRKRVAEGMGITLNALRVRIDRIRAKLEDCVRTCLEQRANM